ncbi:hypothetical protein BaRGS_00008530 [Batillaria attramentaria]|uniref:DNA 3'-5' helicase n=1 Tax=Batillaria attramentaria TaxID=370345 RepID=A0ABD0LMN7_9CAEN
MEDMSTIRRTLKEWEKAFFTVHQRKPSKTDISDAPDKIKGLYRAYYAAKKTTESKPEELTQHSSTSAERQDTSKYGHTSSDANIDLSSPQSLASVWGPELNRNKTTSDSETTAAEKKSSGNLNRFGEKLSAHSCSASPSAGATSVIKKKANICRVDPQSATQVPKPISPSVDSQGTRDQTKVHSSKSDSSDFRLQGELFKKAFRLSTGKKRSISDDVQIPSKFLNHDKPRRQFSLGQKTDADGLNDFNMELGNSDSLKSSGFASGERFHDSAPFDLNTSAGGMIQPGNLSPEQTIGHKLIESKNHNTATSRTEIIISSKNLASSGDNVDSDAGKLSGSVTKDNSRGVGGPTRKSRNSHKSISSLVESAQPYKIPEDDGRPSPDVFAFDANEAGSSEKGGETETFEPGFDTDKGSKVVSKQAKKRKAPVKRKASSAATRPSKKKKICDHDEIENEECDPGSGTSPQNEAAAAKSQPLVTAKMARKPSTSAACKSENFVRLNMKAKKFVRKGARLTGAQWKRKQWKQKMAARSQSFGSDKCFKCGQSGHWANKCPQKGQVSQPGLGIDVTPVDENDFPSLKTAALMARGVQASGGDEVGSDDELAVEAMVVREKHEPDVKPVSATPLSQLISDIGSEMKKGLDKFGFTSFRPGQQETIRRILHGQSTLVILSTGGGKSLCYQLPAYLYAQHARGITLVVSPLVSLMEDQITGLPPGVRGACLNSNMTPAQRDGVLSDVNDGKVHFLLVSPEAVVGGGGRGQGSFPSADKLPPIFFACIDEVHCLSEWSHNFRPSYLRLCKVLREKYGVNCFLGLTATATSSTARDVVRHLDISDMDAATIRGSPVPPNLCLSVSRDENKDEALVSLLQGKRFSACGSVIIYCTRREQVERVATLIRTCLQTRTGEA